jgi:hypothetical protein
MVAGAAGPAQIAQVRPVAPRERHRYPPQDRHLELGLALANDRLFLKRTRVSDLRRCQLIYRFGHGRSRSLCSRIERSAPWCSVLSNKSGLLRSRSVHSLRRRKWCLLSPKRDPSSFPFLACGLGSTDDRSCSGFRTTAHRGGAASAGPSSESLQRKNPREVGGGAAVRAMGISARCPLWVTAASKPHSIKCSRVGT